MLLILQPLRRKGIIILRGEKSFQHRAKMSQAAEILVCHNVVNLKNFTVEMVILIMDLHKTNSLQLVVQWFYLPTRGLRLKFNTVGIYPIK